MGKLTKEEIMSLNVSGQPLSSINLAVLMRFGSVAYGTNSEKSDTDIKGVYIPTWQQIATQNIPPVLRYKSKEGDGKNSAEDVDIELYSLDKFLELMKSGETGALDMFFIPEDLYLVEPSVEWKVLKANKDALLSKKSKAFVGYCVKQAAKYGIKGSHLGAYRFIVKYLRDLQQEFPNYKNFKEFLEKEPFHFSCMLDDAGQREHVTIVEKETSYGTVEKFLSIAGTFSPITNTFLNMEKLFQKKMEQYGNRAQMAETNQGVDWKAMSHALRIGYQAKELLTTGHITFPRPEAKFLKEVKQGLHPYTEVSKLVEAAVDEIRILEKTSYLPEVPDENQIDLILAVLYAAVVAKELGFEIPKEVVPKIPEGYFKANEYEAMESIHQRLHPFEKYFR